MFAKRHLVLLIGLAVFVVACSEDQPSPVYLPTSTHLPAAPTSSPTPFDNLAPAEAPPVASTAPSDSLAPTETPPVSSTAPFDSLAPTETPPAASTTPDNSQPTPTRQSLAPPIIGLEPWLTGFEAPVYFTYASEAPPWDLRVFVVEKGGRILLIENGQVQEIPFLDIVERVGSQSSEQGLLSVAFPPDFDTSEVFYINYTDRRGNTVIARYQLLEGDLPQGDPTSEQILLEIAQPAGNHNGGQLQFGPDGYLYIGMGDGGRAGDPWGNAQNPGELLGKMLRIEVGGDNTYRVPSDNPFVTWSNARSEIWALGLRNPWRFSFDRVTGHLYVADVGQNAYEEVNVQPANSSGGENYGWNIMEGSHCFSPARDCDSTGLILPVAEYDHKLGCSITGGYVYRGARYPRIAGVYFFGDFCSGRIWGLQPKTPGEWDTVLLLESNTAISSFGEDASGELYALDYRGGTVYRLIAAP